MEAVFGPSVSSKYARAIDAEMRKGDMLVATTAGVSKASSGGLLTALALHWVPWFATLSPDSWYSYALMAACGGGGAWLMATRRKPKDTGDMARRIFTGVFLSILIAFPVTKKIFGHYDKEFCFAIAGCIGVLSWDIMETLNKFDFKQLFNKLIYRSAGIAEPKDEEKK